MISAGRGAVDRVEFGVGFIRRVAHRHRDDGSPPPAGASVSSASGELVTLQDGSQVLRSTYWIKRR